jgi:hypothetical protein
LNRRGGADHCTNKKGCGVRSGSEQV